MTLVPSRHYDVTAAAPVFAVGRSKGMSGDGGLLGSAEAGERRRAADGEARVIEALREPARVPECCGRPMRRMALPPTVGTRARLQYVCAKDCGRQQRGEYLEPPRAGEKA